jgi:uncharacterized protein (DUF1697 family)
MSTYILLLRGINVGKANRLPMATLKAVLEQLGAQQVRTLLNSGNAVFSLPTSPACNLLGDQIAAALLAETGLDLHCIVKTAADLQAAAAAVNAEVMTGSNEPDPSRFLLGFCRDPQILAQFASAAAPLPAAGSKLQIGEDALYLYCTDGINQCPIANLLVSKKWRLITGRNLATVQKILAML